MNIAKRLVFWAGLVAAVLMIPLLTNFPWTLSDFVFAGTVLFGAATGYELTVRNMSDRKQRMVVAAGTIAMVIFIWGLAVAD